MSLKENITMVKEELNAEEQFFEQAVKTERFIKRYKKPLIGAAVAVAVGIVSTMGYNAYEASKQAKANEAFLTLRTHPDDAQARETLQAEAPLLYDAWRYGKAVRDGDAATLKALQKSAAPVVADLSAYEAAAIEKDRAALDGYAAKDDAVYRDLAVIDEAVLLLQAKKVSEAHRLLQGVAGESPVYPLAVALMHYGVQ